MSDLIRREDATKAVYALSDKLSNEMLFVDAVIDTLENLPSAEPEIIRCKDCKHWKQQTNYQGTPLSFGFCQSEDMWRSLYGETTEVEHIDTDDNHYCGFADMRGDHE